MNDGFGTTKGEAAPAAPTLEVAPGDHPEATRLIGILRGAWNGPRQANAGEAVHSVFRARDAMWMAHAGSLDFALFQGEQWAAETFGATETTEAVWKHLLREWDELMASGGEAEEIADVLLLLSRFANRMGINLAGAVREKLAELRTRTWSEPDADGVREHVRDAAPAEASS